MRERLATWAKTPSYYACFVIFVWALAPGVRRVVDWRTSFSSISLISVLPLVSLALPAYLLVTSGRGKSLDRRLIYASWIWFGGFLYAYAVGVAAGNYVSATYTLAGFTLPLLFALWLAASDEGFDVVYRRIAQTLLGVATALGIYAFYQFAAPPPWDLAWMQRTALVSIGIPAPFAFRPFSTLNAPGPFADFLTAAILFNLPRMRDANFARFAQLAVCLAALGITLVRADWLALLAGVAFYVALSPGKARNLAVVAVLAIAVGLFVANAPSLLGSSRAGIDLQQRLDTLGDVQTDSSYRDRERYFGDALTTAVDQPTGEGLGVIGTAAKLGSSGATVDFDNGFIARFTEMGYFGTACYLTTLVLTFGLALTRWRAYSRAGLNEDARAAAACVGVQVAFFLLDVSSDHHAQLGGLFYWLSLAMMYGRGAPVVEMAAGSRRSAAFSS